jgi:hypothetical protein
MAYQDTAAVMDMTDLPEVEWKVLLALSHFRNGRTGLCNPNNVTIARFAHMAASNVSRALKSLKEMKLIDWVSGKGKGRGMKANNKYTLFLYTSIEGINDLDTAIDIPSEKVSKHLDTSLIPSEKVETCNPQGDSGVSALDLPPRSGQRSDGRVLAHVHVPPVDQSRRFAETGETPDPQTPTPTLSPEDTYALSHLYNLLVNAEGYVEPKAPAMRKAAAASFAVYGGPLSASVQANVLFWVYRACRHSWWKENLTPTVEDFLRALPKIHGQYEKFYAKVPSGKKPHELWDCQAVIDKVVPPAPAPIIFSAEETYLEGPVSVEEEVVFPKSKAFQIED